MSGTDISNLSYKELQALALRYRVPGNIKKQLLIEVLQAARCGNEQEVDKLLSDLRQTRKKRIRKGKPAKLNLSSTPIHSPTYEMADDYYNAQPRLPYQWVGAEEEIPSNRQDDVNRIPQYEEFRQFLLRRIQRDYQTYGGNGIERIDSGDPGCPGSLMDLRNESDALRFDAEQIGMRSSIVPVNSLESTHQPYPDQIQGQNGGGFDYQILDDPNGNAGHASILLRRMLQAPVGADLGEIASPELPTSCSRVWQTEYHNQGQNNILDNSDTLSANSEVNGNDDNWPNGADYYRFINNVRDQLILNPTNNVEANRLHFYDQSTTGHQFTGVEVENQPVEYQLVYANQITEANQEPWETVNAATFGSEQQQQQTLNHQQYQNLKNYDNAAMSYNGNSHRPIDDADPLQLPTFHGADDNAAAAAAAAAAATVAIYSGNQPGSDCGAPTADASRTEMKFYQNLNVAAASNVRQIEEQNCHFTYGRSPIISANLNYSIDTQQHQQNPEGFIPPMQHISFSSSSAQQSVDQSEQIALDNNQEFNRPSILIGQYNNHEHDHHHHHHHHHPEEQQQQQQQQQHQQLIQKIDAAVEIAEFEKADGDAAGQGAEDQIRNQNRSKTVASIAIQQESQTCGGGPSLEPFWPERTTARNLTDSANQLENILNLNAHGHIDYSKIDQTSCIYCYAAPIVTQRTFSGSASSSCSQKRRFIAEFRQHTFSPYWLLYSDAKTGMQMSRKSDERAAKDEPIDRAERQESSWENKVRDYEEERNDEDEERAAVPIPLDYEGAQNAQLPSQLVAEDSPFRLQEERHRIVAEENAVDQREIRSIDDMDKFEPIARVVLEAGETVDRETRQDLLIDSDKESLAPENGQLDQNGNCNIPGPTFSLNSPTSY